MGLQLECPWVMAINVIVVTVSLRLSSNKTGYDYRKQFHALKSHSAAKLGGRFGYFLFFSARGGGRGSPSSRDGWGIGFLLKIPGGGGFCRKGGAEGREGVCGELGNFWGGG